MRVRLGPGSLLNKGADPLGERLNFQQVLINRRGSDPFFNRRLASLVEPLGGAAAFASNKFRSPRDKRQSLQDK